MTKEQHVTLRQVSDQNSELPPFGSQTGVSRIQPDPEVWKLDQRTWAEQLREKFNKLLGREVIYSGIPKVSIDVYYSAHGDSKDAQGVEKYFKNCDIYIPEMLGWSTSRRQVMNDLSAGKIVPYDAALKIGYHPTNSPHDFQILKMIYKSGKPVAFIDYPKEDMRLQEAIKLGGFADITQYWMLGRTFPEIISEIKRRARANADIERMREGHMLSSLKPALSEVIKSRPDIRKKATKKGSLRVLLSLGSIHTTVSQSLYREGINVSTKIDNGDHVHLLMEEGVRRSRFGKEIDDLLAAQMLAEGLLDAVFHNHLKRALPESQDQVKLYRNLALQFSYKDVEDVVNNCPGGELLKVRKLLLDKVRGKTPALDEHLGISSKHKNKEYASFS